MCSRTLAAGTVFHIIRTRPHSYSFALHDSLLLPLRRERLHPPRNTLLSRPLPSFLSLSLPLIPLFFRLYPTEPLVYSSGSTKSSTQTTLLCSHLVRTEARVCTRRFSNLLIAIEQLSDGKLSYSCSLGPFPCTAPFSRSGLLRILSLHVFICRPFRCRAFILRISFQASDCTINYSSISEKEHTLIRNIGNILRHANIAPILH